ncbi:hypothetical protein IKR55_00545, partial [bacterium]|nr:hypothetical protein [bacterium]
QNSASDTYISGKTNISEGSKVTLDNDKSNITAGNFSGKGSVEKDGSKDLILTGSNNKLTGPVTVKDGAIVYNPDNGTTYFGGKTVLNEDGKLVVKTDKGTSISKVSGTGTIDKRGSGELKLTGDNSGFNGDLDIRSGSLAFGSGTLIGDIDEVIFGDGTSFNLQNTTVVPKGNKKFSTDPNPPSIESLKFNKLTLNGNTKLDIDVDLKRKNADNITADKVSGNGHFVLGKGSINVVTDSLYENTKVRIANGALAEGNWIKLGKDAKSVMGPIQRYDVRYGGGNLSFTRRGGDNPDIPDVNPSIMASSVATQVGGFLTQAQTLQDGFFHMDRYTKYTSSQRLAAETVNQYAINDKPIYRVSELPETSSAMWVKPYTTFEKVDLKNGYNVSNISYGTLYGGDTNLKDLGNGFKGVVSAFVGYNGSHSSYKGIDMNQQGGTLGVTGTLYKGNFFTGITASTGASAGDAYTQFGTDNFAMMTAGIANKTGYNWEIKGGKVIVQPSLFTGYTFVNTFDYTNAAGVKLDSDPLHAIQVVPSVKVIGNLKNGWQPYAGIDMVWNIMDKTNVTAKDVSLPQMSVKPYIQYGVGVQKTWGDRFTGYFQSMIRNGGRTGVVFQAGFRWAIGKDYHDIPDEYKIKNKKIKSKAKTVKQTTPKVEQKVQNQEVTKGKTVLKSLSGNYKTGSTLTTKGAQIKKI